MSIETIFALVSATVAILSLLGTFIIFNVTRYRENYQNLLERINFYSDPEMMLAVQKLWALYRDYKENFPEKYIEIMISENKKIEKRPQSERLNLQVTTLHYQRRIVSQFWKGLSILMKNNLIPQKSVYDWWSQDDIEIIEKVIIPIENKLAEHYNVPKVNKKTNPLYHLVKVKHRFYK